MQNFIIEHPEIFLDLLDTLDEGIVIHKKDTSIIYVNTSASSILGLSYEQLIGKDAMDPSWHFISEDGQRLKVEEYPVNVILKTKKNIKSLVVGVNQNEEKTRWLNVGATISTLGTKEELALIHFHDITSRKEAYDKALLFKKCVESVDTGISISDPRLEDNPLVYVNTAFTKITGYTYEEAIGHNCRYLQDEKNTQAQVEVISKAIKNEQSIEIELENFTKDGKKFYNLLNISPIFDTQNKLQYFVGVQHDITKIKEQEAKIKEQAEIISAEKEKYKNLAEHDSLSRVYNRQYINDNYKRYKSAALRNMQHSALILLDIDNFKKVNDIYGHNVGDDVLVHLCKVINEKIRIHDILVRWGGDEFIVLASVNNAEEAYDFAEKLRKSVETDDFKDVDYITITAGVTLMLEDETMQESVKRADDALYRAKENGRNRVELEIRNADG